MAKPQATNAAGCGPDNPVSPCASRESVLPESSSSLPALVGTGHPQPPTSGDVIEAAYRLEEELREYCPELPRWHSLRDVLEKHLKKAMLAALASPSPATVSPNLDEMREAHHRADVDPSPAPGCPECGWNDVHSPQCCRHCGAAPPSFQSPSPQEPLDVFPAIEDVLAKHCRGGFERTTRENIAGLIDRICTLDAERVQHKQALERQLAAVDRVIGFPNDGLGRIELLKSALQSAAVRPQQEPYGVAWQHARLRDWIQTAIDTVPERGLKQSLVEFLEADRLNDPPSAAAPQESINVGSHKDADGRAHASADLDRHVVALEDARTNQKLAAAVRPLVEQVKALEARWLERERKLCRRADLAPTRDYARLLSAEAEHVAQCADELAAVFALLEIPQETTQDEKHDRSA